MGAPSSESYGIRKNPAGGLFGFGEIRYHSGLNVFLETLLNSTTLFILPSPLLQYLCLEGNAKTRLLCPPLEVSCDCSQFSLSVLLPIWHIQSE